MDEINKLQNRVKFLEDQYKELVEEMLDFTCMCNKPYTFHVYREETELRNELLKRIDEKID